MKYNLSFINKNSFFLSVSPKRESNLILNLDLNLGNYIYNTKLVRFIFISNFSNKFYLKKRVLHYNLLNISSILRNFNVGYSIELILVGLGFKVLRSKTMHQLRFELHYSHLVVYKIPNDISIKCGKKKLLVFGLVKQRVMNVATEIKQLRVPNVYKGKGIRFISDIVKLKPGKQR